MRGLAYVIAAIAAVGIMIGIASFPDERDSDDSVAAPVETVSSRMTEAGTVTLAVPSMHCEFACFPRVQKALQDSAGVASVELAEQQEEGVLDNRQVIVNYEPGFDLAAALTSLKNEGFDDTDVVQ